LIRISRRARSGWFRETGHPIAQIAKDLGIDPGTLEEYTAGMFRAACIRLGMRQSMGRPGSALDNAVIESWHSTLEFELRSCEEFPTKAAARRRVAAWIDEYNRARRHSSIGMISPIDYELAQPEDPDTEVA
jgi:putative transposase